MLLSAGLSMDGQTIRPMCYVNVRQARPADAREYERLCNSTNCIFAMDSAVTYVTTTTVPLFPI